MLSIVLHGPANREKLPDPVQPVIAVTLHHDEHFKRDTLRAATTTTESG